MSDDLGLGGIHTPVQFKAVYLLWLAKGRMKTCQPLSLRLFPACTCCCWSVELHPNILQVLIV